MEFRLRPSPRMRTLYAMYAGAAVCVGVFGWSVLSGVLIPETTPFLAALAGLPTALCLAIFAYWLPKYCDSVECVIAEGRVVARRGVWWKSESSVPLAKVNDVTWQQGLL